MTWYGVEKKEKGYDIYFLVNRIKDDLKENIAAPRLVTAPLRFVSNVKIKDVMGPVLHYARGAT